MAEVPGRRDAQRNFHVQDKNTLGMPGQLLLCGIQLPRKKMYLNPILSPVDGCFYQQRNKHDDERLEGVVRHSEALGTVLKHEVRQYSSEHALKITTYESTSLLVPESRAFGVPPRAGASEVCFWIPGDPQSLG